MKTEIRIFCVFLPEWGLYFQICIDLRVLVGGLPDGIERGFTLFIPVYVSCTLFSILSLCVCTIDLACG